MPSYKRNRFGLRVFCFCSTFSVLNLYCYSGLVCLVRLVEKHFPLIALQRDNIWKQQAEQNQLILSLPMPTHIHFLPLRREEGESWCPQVPSRLVVSHLLHKFIECGILYWHKRKGKEPRRGKKKWKWRIFIHELFNHIESHFRIISDSDLIRPYARFRSHSSKRKRNCKSHCHYVFGD